MCGHNSKVSTCQQPLAMATEASPDSAPLAAVLAEIDLENESAVPIPPPPEVASPAAAEGTVLSDGAGAERFFQTMGAVGATLSTLTADDAAAGFKSLGDHEKEVAITRWDGFKSHAAAIDRTNGWRGVRDTADGAQLANLPAAAAHALLAMLFVVLFAAVFYPAK